MKKALLIMLSGVLAASWGCIIFDLDEPDDRLSSGSIDCLVNGKLLVIDSESGNVGLVNGPEDLETFHIFSNREGNPDLGLDLFAGIVVKEVPATFPLGAGIEAHAEYRVMDYPDVWGYGTYDPPSGSMTITRLDRHGCEGTFSFRGRSLKNGSEVNVTDGRFNLHR